MVSYGRAIALVAVVVALVLLALVVALGPRPAYLGHPVSGSVGVDVELVAAVHPVPDVP